MRAPVRHFLRHLRPVAGSYLRLSDRYPRASSRSRIPARSSACTEAAQDISFAAMVEHSHGGHGSSRTIPTWRRELHRRRDGFGPPLINRAACIIQSEAARPSAAVIRRQSDPGAAAASSRRFRASSSSCSRCRTSTSAAAQQVAQYQYTLQDGDPDELYPLGQTCRKRDSADCPDLLDVNSDLQLATGGRSSISTREGVAELGITVDQVRDTLFSAFGTRQIADIYAPSNSYSVILEVDAAVPAASRATCSRSMSGRAAASWCRSGAIAAMMPAVGPVTINHQGQLPVGDHLLQSGAGHVAWRGGRSASPRSSGRPTCRPRWPPASRATPQVFQKSLARPGHAAARRRAGHLHGARHSL